MDAFILDAIRTPRGKGKPGGALYEVKAIQLISQLMHHLVVRNPVDTACIDDVVLGCVSAIGDQGGNLAKIASLYSGWNENIGGVTLNRFCASGAEAVNLATMKILSGWEQLVVAGGVESMSRIPILSDGGPWALDPETNFKTGFLPQGIGADLIATIDGYDRVTLDEYAVRSHHRACDAWQRGAFSNAVMPVIDINGEILLEKDQLVRSESCLGSMSALNPSFEKMGEAGFDVVAKERYPDIERIQHLHHPGNSSGLADGAALLLLGNAEQAKRWKIEPKARVVSCAVVGTDPTIMLTGPAPATKKALTIAGLKSEQIDLWEVNEAFASVVLRFQREMRLDPETINVNGGAIAMGHPLGATGAMLIGSLMDELAARELRYGVVAMCVGGGMGIATVIENLQKEGSL